MILYKSLKSRTPQGVIPVAWELEEHRFALLMENKLGFSKMSLPHPVEKPFTKM